MGKTYRRTKNVWEDGESRDNRSRKKARKKLKLAQRRRDNKQQVYDVHADSGDSYSRRQY